MPSSIRMDEDLLARLRAYAERRELSSSAVVREALAQSLDQQEPSPYKLGLGVFGKHRSSSTGSARSVGREFTVYGGAGRRGISQPLPALTIDCCTPAPVPAA